MNKAEHYYSIGKEYLLERNKNIRKIISCFTKSAKYGNSNAMFILGLIYDNFHKKNELYEEISELYMAELENNIYYNITKIELNDYYKKEEKYKKISFYWYLLAAKNGNGFAQYVLGKYYYEGINVKQDYEEALKWFELSANNNILAAIKKLGDMYYYGNGTKRNYEEALRWYLLVEKINKNDHYNKYSIGKCYYQLASDSYYDRNKEKNYEEIIKLFKLSSNYGNPDAKYFLGKIYSEDRVIVKNIEEANKWYSLAFDVFLVLAEKGDSSRQYDVANCYYEGIGIEQNYEEAVKWYKLSSENKDTNPMAQYRIGLCYYYGKGVPQSYEEAVKWYLLFINNKKTEYYYRITEKYYFGIEEEKDIEEAIKWYIYIAEKGDGQIKADLAYCYYLGKGIEQNYEEAVKWFLLAAEEGNINALYRLGECYEKGKGAEQNYEKAFEYYKLLADNDYEDAQCILGCYYEYGKGVEQNYEEAVKWYELSAETDYPYALYKLGTCYYFGKGVEQNYNKAVELFNQLELLTCDDEYPELNYLSYAVLGWCYYAGYGVEQNIEIAERYFNGIWLVCLSEYASDLLMWLKLAANQGLDIAQYKLGLCYKNGYGVPQDYEEAVKWFRIAIENGYIGVYNVLGICYVDGHGVEQSYEEAAKCFRIAAEQGNEIAQYNLALCYEQGQGVPQDYKEAAKWFKLAAEQGDAHSQYNLGLYYYKGQGVPQDYEKAFKWWKLAEDKGLPIARNNLGLCYYEGQGVEKDLNQALYYFDLAINSGFEEARENYEKVLKEIEELSQKEKLHLGDRKDIFVSWNHLDQEIKNTLCQELEERNLFTVWESDTNGIGHIDEVIENAILQSRSYLIILTGNSIYSKWVEKEIEIILNKVQSYSEYEHTIRPIVYNTKTINNEKQYFDVLEAIKTFDDNSPFKKLLSYCFHFENNELNYDKLANLLKEGISNSIKLEYREKVKSKFQRFSSAINNVTKNEHLKSGIISATFEFEKGYLNRPLYDNNGNKIQIDEIFKENKNVLIYGEGGTGKSLYLKNYLRNKFNENRYIFYLPCKDVVNDIETNKDINEILKEKAFDIYFSKEEAELLTPNSFEQILESNNDIIILMDALDEVSKDIRKKLINKLQLLHIRYKNIYIIFTSRNKEDSLIINNTFNQEISVYELRKLSQNEIEKLYDILSSKVIIKEETNNERTIGYNISKQAFFINLENITEEIKSNPLLLSNLIIIYFATQKVMTSTYDVINESVNIMVKEIDTDKNITFKYKEYLEGNKLNELLGYFALQRANNNLSESNEIIKKYLINKYQTIEDPDTVANEIFGYLRRRSVIVNNRITHDIFGNYFVATYLYNKIYKNSLNDFDLEYITYTDTNKFSEFSKHYFIQNEVPWPNISVDLLYKLDYEIYKVNQKMEMNKEHLSYEVFNDTLIKAIKDKEFSENAIKIIEEVITKDTFHFNEFIKLFFK